MLNSDRISQWKPPKMLFFLQPHRGFASVRIEGLFSGGDCRRKKKWMSQDNLFASRNVVIFWWIHIFDSLSLTYCFSDWNVQRLICALSSACLAHWGWGRRKIEWVRVTLHEYTRCRQMLAWPFSMRVHPPMCLSTRPFTDLFFAYAGTVLCRGAWRKEEAGEYESSFEAVKCCKIMVHQNCASFSLTPSRHSNHA